MIRRKMAAPKKYGLIIPSKSAKKSVTVSRPSIFADESDDEDSREGVNKTIHAAAKTAALKRQAQLAMEKALEEDPTVYEYDSIYDDMQKVKQGPDGKSKKKEAEKKPKYIQNLLKAAEKRKREDERRVERQVQKERVKEKGMYDDSESFVTGAYKKKLQEMQEEEEKERRRNEMEAMMDVTKQRDLSGFYRHFLNQATGEEAVPSNLDTPATKKEAETSAIFSEDHDLTPSGSESSSNSSSDSDSDSDDYRKSRRHHKGYGRLDQDDTRCRHENENNRYKDRHRDRDTGRDRDAGRDGRGQTRRREHQDDGDDERSPKQTSDSKCDKYSDGEEKAQRKKHSEDPMAEKPSQNPKRKQDEDSDESDKPIQGPAPPPADRAEMSKKGEKSAAEKYAKHTHGASLSDAKARYLARKQKRQVALAPDDN